MFGTNFYAVVPSSLIGNCKIEISIVVKSLACLGRQVFSSTLRWAVCLAVFLICLQWLSWGDWPLPKTWAFLWDSRSLNASFWWLNKGHSSYWMFRVRDLFWQEVKICHTTSCYEKYLSKIQLFAIFMEQGVNTISY